MFPYTLQQAGSSVTVSQPLDWDVKDYISSSSIVNLSDSKYVQENSFFQMLLIEDYNREQIIEWVILRP